MDASLFLWHCVAMCVCASVRLCVAIVWLWVKFCLFFPFKSKIRIRFILCVHMSRSLFTPREYSWDSRISLAIICDKVWTDRLTKWNKTKQFGWSSITLVFYTHNLEVKRKWNPKINLLVEEITEFGSHWNRGRSCFSLKDSKNY